MAFDQTVTCKTARLLCLPHDVIAVIGTSLDVCAYDRLRWSCKTLRAAFSPIVEIAARGEEVARCSVHTARIRVGCTFASAQHVYLLLNEEHEIDFFFVCMVDNALRLRSVRLRMGSFCNEYIWLPQYSYRPVTLSCVGDVVLFASLFAGATKASFVAALASRCPSFVSVRADDCVHPGSVRTFSGC